MKNNFVQSFANIENCDSNTVADAFLVIIKYCLENMEAKPTESEDLISSIVEYQNELIIHYFNVDAFKILKHKIHNLQVNSKVKP